MKKIIYFFIFVFCISFAYAQPAIPTVQIYGNIDAPDGSSIVFERDGIEAGSGTVQNGKYGYDPVIFLDAEAGDSVDVFVDDVFVSTITLQEEGNVNIDLTMPAAPPEEEEEIIPRRGGGMVIPTINYTVSFSELPQSFNVRSGYKIFLTFDGVEHTIRVARLSYQIIELLINSTPLTLNLNVNDTGEVDLNDDGTNDISILYEGVQANYGVIIISQLAPPASPVITPPIVPEPLPSETAPLPSPEPEVGALAPVGFPWTGILITIIIIGILGGIGFVFYEIKRSHGSLQQEKTQRGLDQQSFMRLQSYVKQTLEQGYTKEQIRQTLLNEGWPSNLINKVIR
ncbi:hypothetical protein KY343_00105 [Candidatus Woesearchaeota archaeon]|nr:hypothetical protein [Candidatus Woesearchaeota archaeon]